LICRFRQAKQSSLAPVAGALLLRFLGAAEALLLLPVLELAAAAVVLSAFGPSAGWVAGDDMAMADINEAKIVEE
jgi:hypothetical protein